MVAGLLFMGIFFLSNTCLMFFFAFGLWDIGLVTVSNHIINESNE